MGDGSKELTHPLIVDGWFREVSDEYFPGQAFMLKVEKILHAEKSQFQDILVFKSTDFGNVLVLDGIIQVTERDEFAYQEMITHVPLFGHPNPKKVLVIGGGDGGVLREVVKHDCVESATLVEIDDMVIKLSKKYLPNMAKSYTHEKVQVFLQDGFKFLKDCESRLDQDKYDVIITDSSDPDGPAEAFFQQAYFKLLFNALNKDGIVISMASENIWLNINNLKKLKDVCQTVFPVVKTCYCTMPTYTSGQISLMCCGKNADIDVAKPSRKLSAKKERELFRYYNSEIHSASFVLPTWAAQILDDNNGN
ncbi:spermine synthase [Pichia membranifaciens]|uniref:Spermine synthase n=1 Tax=Pichia membranifaciens TaxID=4926 RepID=A0A1Q2YEW7_9ASCO|nr:spermine synthase [Pichia membranifaciens]